MEIEERLRSHIVRFALAHYDVTLDEVLSSTRVRHVVHARAMIVWLARTYRPQAGFVSIGRWLGKPHQTAGDLYQTGHRLHCECPHFARGAEDFAAEYRTTMEVPYACA